MYVRSLSVSVNFPGGFKVLRWQEDPLRPLMHSLSVDL